MNEKFLYKHFVSAPPKWPCPSCDHGVLSVHGEKFDSYFDSGSKRDSAEEWFDPDMNKLVFCCVMECNVCEETVIVSGVGGVEQDYDNYPFAQRQWCEYYEPKFFQPSLRIIQLPPSEKLPITLVELLEKSFSLFWCDYDACANRIRSALEVLLDGINIPRRVKPRPAREISLHDRIELIDAVAGSDMDDIKQMIMAVKWIGNAGTHELNGITHDQLIDGYKMLELALQLLYPTPSDAAELIARARAINLAKKSR